MVDLFLFMLAIRPEFDLQIHNYFKLFFSIFASFHITYVIIIFIIRIIYSLYTLIYKRDLFLVKNSPLNRYASIVSQALYCLKVDCAATGAGASVIAGGMAYDALLVEAGRPPKFIHFMAAKLVFTGVFGEVPKNLASQRPGLTADNNGVESVTELLTKYHNLSRSDRLDFITEINNEYEAKERAKNKKY